jgi:PBP1b-binding outer membrane lipoprotein LpoB
MRNAIISIVSMALFSVFIFAGCDSSAEKVADARENVKDAKDNVADAEYELLKAKQDSTAEFLIFKRESEDKITKLDNKIAELKLKISKEQGNAQNESLKLLKAFEEKTELLKKELNDYKKDKNEDWKVFRNNFNENMDELGKSLSNFYTDTK